MSGSDGNKSLTFTHQWKYVPGKKFTLNPLNLQAIKKQMNTSDEESDNETFTETDSGKITDILNESFNAGSPKNDSKTESKEPTFSEQECSNAIIENKANNQKHAIFSPSLETVPEKTHAVCHNKENFAPNNMEPLNLSRDKKRNDSFDLDLSALTLHTPVKKIEKPFNVTPRINIIPPSASRSTMKSSVPVFKTPNVANKKPRFKTPVNHQNSYSVRKGQTTPYSLVKGSALKKYNMAADLESVKPKPVIFPGNDGFNNICVNDVEYIVMNLLGRGGSSEVFYGYNPEEKLEVAIKLVSLSDQAAAEGYINEVKLLESLQTCDRIVKMYDYELTDEKLLVVLEKGGDDLSTILKQLATKQLHLPTYKLLFYWMEMLYAVKQIHDNGVIHSDLKPANFLWGESGLKLIDFGIAGKVQGDMTCVYKSNQEGSCNYISPEALSFQNTGNIDSPTYGKPKYKVHFKSDVWSLGCILYQLVYRKTPFQDLNPIFRKLAAITNQNHKISYPSAVWVPPRIVHTVKRCLQYDVKLRPSVDELIAEYEQL